MDKTIGISLMPNMTCAAAYQKERTGLTPLSGCFGSMFSEASRSLNADAAVGVISAVEALPRKRKRTPCWAGPESPASRRRRTAQNLWN